MSSKLHRGFPVKQREECAAIRCDTPNRENQGFAVAKELENLNWIDDQNPY